MKILPDTHRQVYCPKCRRLVIATVEDLKVGFTCIRCGAKIIQPEGYNDPVLYDNVKDVIAQRALEQAEKEAKEQAEKEAREQAEKEAEEKAKKEAEELAKLEGGGEEEDTETAASQEEGEEGEEGEEAPKKGYAICPGCGFHTEIIHKNKTLVQCEACHKFFQKPYDPEHDQEKVVLPSDTLPSEQHLLLLSELNFCGIPASGREATSTLLIIRDCIEKGFKQTYPAYRFLPPEMKRSIIVTFACSPYFSQMYFDNKSYTEKELDMIMVIAIPDSELLSSIKNTIKTSVFKNTVKYINEFMQYNFGDQLDRDIPELLALKTFNRGFGKSLKTYDDVIYNNSAKKKNIVEDEILTEKKMLEFYNRKTPAHTQLEHLLNENGYFRKKEQKSEGMGCLILVAFFISCLSIFFTI